jgi:hypothetical protein
MIKYKIYDFELWRMSTKLQGSTQDPTKEQQVPSGCGLSQVMTFALLGELSP